VGDSEEVGKDYMVITQSARFKGYKGMDPSLIPQFEQGEKEVIAGRRRSVTLLLYL
jgi:hypothetical protein